MSADPGHLHLAAYAFVYPIADGSMTYGEAVSAIMCAAIRERELVDRGDMNMQWLRERLEKTLNRAITEVSCESADAIRKGITSLLGRRASKHALLQAAHATNRERGGILPRACVDWLVLEEVRKAVGMPPSGSEL